MSPSIFSKMSDSKAVVQFVREIEKYPCLYDQRSLEYANRALKRKTWVHIAKTSNCTVAECKEKWRKIRIAYIRTLRPFYHNGVRTFSRPYYLASYLKFISPFKKKSLHCIDLDSVTSEKDELPNVNENKGNKSNGPIYETQNEERVSDHKVFLDEMHNTCENEDVINDCVNTKDFKEIVLSDVNKITEVSGHNSSKIEKRKTCCGNIECNPRKMFLLSLLPEIEALSEFQMRKFRREVIDLIDKVLCE